ncbi:MAG: hypothetical protein RIB84_22290 [Sneathiellaceae bacterium]
MLQTPTAATMQALRQAIRAQEDSLRGSGQRTVVPLGLPAVDAALPWGGLPVGSLHEVCAAAAGGTGEDAVALAFAAFLAGRFQQAARQAAGQGEGQGRGGGMAGRGEVVWCRLLRRRQEGGLPYGPGLRAHGLDPDALILAEARREEDLLWALEEALRDGRAAVVLGEAGTDSDGTGLLPDIALRRLQLAAERAGLPLLLLRREPGGAGRACPSLTRWRVQAHPSIRSAEGGRAGEGEAAESATIADILPEPAWQLDLLRCRGGRPGQWTVAGGLAVPVGQRGRPGGRPGGRADGPLAGIAPG